MLPADQIQQIAQAQGTVTKGVLSIEIERQDVGDVAGPLGVQLSVVWDSSKRARPTARRM
jgi:hypothetical protein